MMPDHWGFVAAAYAVTALILGGYWRMLVRKERELATLGTGTRVRTEAGVGTDPTSRTRQPSETGHPRPEPSSRPPLP